MSTSNNLKKHFYRFGTCSTCHKNKSISIYDNKQGRKLEKILDNIFPSVISNIILTYQSYFDLCLLCLKEKLDNSCEDCGSDTNELQTFSWYSVFIANGPSKKICKFGCGVYQCYFCGYFDPLYTYDHKEKRSFFPGGNTIRKIQLIYKRKKRINIFLNICAQCYQLYSDSLIINGDVVIWNKILPFENKIFSLPKFHDRMMEDEEHEEKDEEKEDSRYYDSDYEY